MTTPPKRHYPLYRLPLALAVLAGLAMPVQAKISFNLMGFETDVEGRLSAGIGVRVESQDKDLISQGNLGPEFAFTNTGASSNNFDDGNLNFEQGDPYTQFVSGRLDIFTQYFPDLGNVDRVGGFLRTRYVYDYELHDEERALDPVGQRRSLTQEGRDNAAQGEILDAYVFMDGFVFDRPYGIRYGRQVLNWGESTFIQGGINTTSPLDAPAARKPGAQLEEILIPVEMLYGNMTFGDLTLEAFLQTKWEPFKVDDCGTYFSTADVASDGCGPVLLGGQVPDSQALEEGFLAPRESDQVPPDRGQFGVAGRYFSDMLNGEVGLYYQRLHSRLPLLSGRANNPSSPSANQDNTQAEPFTAFPSYFVEYPEDIDQFGISYSTTLLGGTSIGGEYSYKRNLPVQINTIDLIFAGLQQRGPNGEILSKYERQLREQNPDKNFAREAVPGFKRFGVSQLQGTVIHFVDRVMGADRFIFLAEVGGTYVHDLPDQDVLEFGRSGLFGVGPRPVEGENFTGDNCREGPGGSVGQNINPSNCRSDGYTTAFSWGYRTVFAWQYNNSLWGANLTPSIFFSHDVKGYAPEPAANFREGNKQLGLTLNATFLNAYSAELTYSAFFDGRYNDVRDRDFVAASINYTF
ncbi:MAG: DUF1302 domain-containing protein [Oleiphilaceae bacterium]|nr:DUF1302 domain-containing protein [Oleiphilaceae bacterium]